MSAIFFPKIEEGILKTWQDNKIFQKSLDQRKAEPVFSFYDGPPFASGLPHYGHIVASLMKDIIPRFWTMKGYYVERRWGWDCHGLPIENIVEEEMKVKSKKEIVEKIGIEKFNEVCRSKVMLYRSEWRKVIDRMGRWVDMDNDYKTMDTEYMESIWWVFKQMWNMGLIYEDYKSMHICPRCETTLAQAEVTEGYRMVKDLSVVVKFELLDEPRTYLLAWTTTPWTLIGNVALAVGKDIEYVRIKNKESRIKEEYIIAKDRLESVGGKFDIIEKFKGKKLEGKKYKPLFDYYINDTKLENKENLYTIQTANFVSTEEGTGIVHIAPAFGEDDMNLGKEKKLPFIQHVNIDGTFKKKVKELSGLHVKPKNNIQETDKKITDALNKKGLLFSASAYEHSYPHCWRCESPLLNYATNSWFVAVTNLKERMIKNAKDIHWTPSHLKEGRFGMWISQARDWAISRQRFWGSVMPVWKCECGEISVFGSVKELGKASRKKITDLHKHVIDKITVPCPSEKCNGMMKRIPDVLDCWFESGSMPYAQLHYPFENEEKFEHTFPAHFIAEGVDQCRTWFYYLHIIATALFNKTAFKNVIANGIVLAEDGKKMSKRLKNYPAPEEIFNEYGADALRYYLATSGVMVSEDLRFQEREVVEVYRNIILLILNILTFYKTYVGKIQNPNLAYRQAGSKIKAKNILDQWILARHNQLIEEVSLNLDNYDIMKAARPIKKFINDLSTWYLRRSRERFKNGDSAGIAMFGKVLLGLSKVMAPFTPYIAEYLYGEIGGKKESVHLEEWPIRGKSSKLKVQSGSDILKNMELSRKIVELGLAKRAEAKIKVRQPLQKLKAQSLRLKAEYVALIKDELNVKEVEFVKGRELAVELDTTITKDLELEGLAREFIRQINNNRKEKKLTIHDTINISYQGNIDMVIQKFRNEILQATISKKIEKGQGEKEIDINGIKVLIKLEKVIEH